MKNVLFASTALVAFAGAAAADVTVSGSAEMGIFAADGVDWQFHNDVDVVFTLSGETDTGLAFGTSIDLDEAGGLGNEESNLGAAIFLSGAFGTLTLGDTDGAIDWALTEVNFNSGSIRDDETSHAGFNGNAALDGFAVSAAGLVAATAPGLAAVVDPSNDGFTFGDNQVLRYDYTINDFAFAVSLEQVSAGDEGFITPDANAIVGEIYGVGFKYSADFGGTALNFGLGYQALSVEGGNDADAIGASLNSTFGAVTAGISYLSVDLDSGDAGVDAFESYDHVGVGVGYTEGAISASANYGKYDYDDGSDKSGFGLSAGYDLGGGASIQAGYGNSDNRNGTDTESFSFGVKMAF